MSVTSILGDENDKRGFDRGEETSGEEGGEEEGRGGRVEGVVKFFGGRSDEKGGEGE